METRNQYLRVLKHAVQKTEMPISEWSQIIHDIMSHASYTDEAKHKLNWLKLREAAFNKIKELEVLAETSPEVMDLPIPESELVDVETLDLIPV